MSNRELFAGRMAQMVKIMEAVSQRGYHAVLYGERGVGKTSLANILLPVMQNQGYLVTRVNCDAGDSYSTLWRKVFSEITYYAKTNTIGFVPETQITSARIVDGLPTDITPDDVRRTLISLGQQAPILVVLDEYDRISKDSNTSTLVSDTIKALSDFGVNASVLLIGVAESVGDLVSGHLSIERALVQVPMPRMSNDEIRAILDNGLIRLGMTVEPGAASHLVDLAQGVPYIAHLLALWSSKSALMSDSLNITRAHVDMGIERSLDQWQQSIKTSYYEAVKSSQPGNIYREVLLACALAEVDDMGYFTAAAVRGPLRYITDRQLDIPNFSGHLKQFSEEIRGGIIERVGIARRLRYRFVSPLMRPYVVMRGHADMLLK